MRQVKLTRRRLLHGAAAGSLSTLAPSLLFAASSSTAIRTVTATTGSVPLLGKDQPKTPIWGFDGGVPGPTLHAQQGEPFSVRIVNQLDESTSVHWHGIRIANNMDGVPDLTQSPIEPGESFDYKFVPPDAGTYWYHSHQRSVEQVGRGLYGALIVNESDPPDVDQDIVLMIDDWSIAQNGHLNDNYGAMHASAHGGRFGNWITVNGQTRPNFPVTHGQRVRLRLINPANARIMGIGLNAKTSWIVALDGQPLVQPTTLEDVIYLGPGQRADVIADITEDPGATLALILHDADEVYEIAYLKCDEKSKRELRSAPPPPLRPNDIASNIDPKDAMNVDLLMEGGAMGGLRDASLNGQLLSIRDLAAQGYVWAFNGVAGLPDKPLFQAKRGESVIVNIDNQNRWPHAMHVHGHHFQVHGGNDDEDVAPWRDTAIIDSGEMLKFAFVADNPGKWLLHCHMLEHQAAGMMTWFEVS